MSVETISPVAGPDSRLSRSGRSIRTVAGVLADGTACYAPFGEVVVVDGALVTCHLCGRSLRSVTAHLKAHGWTKAAYCEAFGLERDQSLEGPPTRKLRAAALTARLVFDASIQEGSAVGRERARAGGLTRDAAPFPSSAAGRPCGRWPGSPPPPSPGPTRGAPASGWPRWPPRRPAGRGTPTSGP